MKALLARFSSFSLLVQVLWVFCFFGMIAQACWLCQDLLSQRLLWRLHLGFFILYTSQVGLILVKEKWVCILTILQGMLALFTTANFIFSPLLRFVGGAYFIVTIPSIERLKVYQYVIVSLAFTLQMFSAYVLFVEFNDSTEEPPSREGIDTI